MIEKNGDTEECQFPEENEETLSLRMQKLNFMGITAKSMADLQKMKNEAASKSKTNTPMVPQPARPSLPLAFTKRQPLMQQSSTKRKANNTISAKKEGYKLEDGRMFELLSEAKGRRMAMVKEVLHMRIRDYCGRGLLVFPNGKKFQGEWVEGRLIGRAKITQSNGDIYVGNTYNFHAHGQGVLTYFNGERYVGEFSSGDCHGEGILYDPLGKVIYEGEWRRGKRVET